MSILETITKLHPACIEKHTIPVLLKQLETCSEKALDIIKVLGSLPVIFKIIIAPYLQILDQSLRQTNQTYRTRIAKTLLDIYTNAAKKDCEILEYAQEKMIPNIVRLCFDAVYHVSDIKLDDEVIEVFAMMAAVTIRLSKSKLV